MSFEEMFAEDLPTFYEALGEPAVYTDRFGVSSEIMVLPGDDFIVEYADYDHYKAMKSDVPDIQAGDTLVVRGAECTLHNANPTEDGREVVMAVSS